MQSFARTWCLEILLDIVFTKFVVYFDEEINEFRLCSGRYSTRKFKLISENENVQLSLADQSR